MTLFGAIGTLYAHESYTLRFRFSEDYPMEAPEACRACHSCKAYRRWR